MDASELQQELFQVIKKNIPANVSATDEIARVLDVSVDSVYRRMRGEKTISLEELYKLSSHYKISLDQLMDLQTGAFQFRGNFLNNKTFRSHCSRPRYRKVAFDSRLNLPTGRSSPGISSRSCPED